MGIIFRGHFSKNTKVSINKHGFNFKRIEENYLQISPQRGCYRCEKGRLPSIPSTHYYRTKPPRYDGCEIIEIKRMPQPSLQLGMVILLPHPLRCQLPHQRTW